MAGVIPSGSQAQAPSPSSPGFLWALQNEAAFGAGSACARAENRASALRRASPPAWPPWWARCSFPAWWLRRNWEGKDNSSLCLLKMVLFGHGLRGSLSALAGYVALQEQWWWVLPTCLHVQSWAGHRQPGQQVAEGLADPSPTPRTNHSNKSRGQKSALGKRLWKKTKKVYVGQALPSAARQRQEQLAPQRLTSL